MKNTTLAIIIVLGIAVGVTAYRYIMDEDETPQKTFAVTAVIGALVAVIALYAFSTGRPKISREPFVLDAPLPPQIPAAQTVPMPVA
jgi:drug/metabolite transporter (DMT)-like permease